MLEAIKERVGLQIETEMNDWSWAWFVVGLSNGCPTGRWRRKRRTVLTFDIETGLPASQQGNRTNAFPFLSPLGTCGWLVDESWDSTGFIPRVKMHFLALIR